MKIVAALLALLACALTAPADCRVVTVQHHQQHVQAVVATPVVAAVFTPVVVTVPQYSVGVAPGYAPPAVAAAPAAADSTKMLLDEIKGLRADVEAMRSRPKPNVEVPAPKQDAPAPEYVPPVPKLSAAAPPAAVVAGPAGEHPGKTVMAAICARCHSETSAKAKGGNVVLFKAGQFVDEGDNLERAVVEMDSGRMPKGGKLSAEEKYAVLSWLLIRPAAEKK